MCYITPASLVERADVSVARTDSKQASALQMCVGEVA